MSSLSDFPPDVIAAANDAMGQFLRDDRCGTAARFGMAGKTQNALGEAIARAILADRAGRLNTTGLTIPQTACLKAIADYQARHGVSPSYAELAVVLGMGSRSGAFKLVRGLAERGAVILGGANQSRSIAINPELRSRA